MHVALVIGSPSAGGAQRVIALMANHWTARGVRVTMFTFDDGKIPFFFPLADGVNWRPLNIFRATANVWSALLSNFHQWRVLRSALREAKPDVAVAFLDQSAVLTILATRGTGIPTVVSERNHPFLTPLPALWKLLRRLVYPFAEKLVLQTERVGDILPAAMRHRAIVIPNPVIAPERMRDTQENSEAGGKRIVAVGRLCEQKGFDLLINAFARVAPKHPEWKVEIWGEGPSRTELQALIDSQNLGSRIALPGNTGEVYKKLASADLFVFPSRHEGFPNALCEAMAAGLPVISADCLFGPREIIRDGVDGILVAPENVDDLTAAIERLLSDEAKRHELAQRAREIVQRFGIDAVMSLWDEALASVLPAPGASQLKSVRSASP